MASRVTGVVKKHIPLIKFPQRKGVAKIQQQTSSTVADQPPKQETKHDGYNSRQDLPAKYQRKPLSKEEILTIELGGATT